MSRDDVSLAVRIAGGRVPLEASGGVRLDTVAAIAAAGVDYISVGAITHSISALDISLELDTAALAAGRAAGLQGAWAPPSEASNMGEQYEGDESWLTDRFRAST